ncbi:MAG: protein kinase [Myxococcota bacterium]
MDGHTHLPAGTLVDGFRVKRRLAEGAMGEVYLAQDERLGRKVALKFIKAVLVDDASRERFFSEARTTARFAHPHIVTVYAAGAFEGRPYLALEYLDGETLRERIDRTPPSVAEALRVGRAIAEALAEAHRHGVIHADLKPENVVVPSDGRPRVVDFGLARLTGASSVTASGTPAYMAPERWKGAPPSPAIDVWSFGVLLHELLEGERPLSDAELAHFVYAPTAVPLGKTAAHHRVGALLKACLAVEPSSRPTAEEVARQLGALLVVGAPPADDARSPFRGLEAFREADASDFTGREAEVAHAVEALRGNGALTVVGPSGIGKSSFVFAGVTPRLREGGKWTVAALKPGRRPLWSLALALTTCRVTKQDSRSGATLEAQSPLSRDVEALAAALAAEPGALPRALREVAQATGGRVLLLVDQLEELFTLGAPEQLAPCAQALSAAASADEPWRLVLSLRGDFLGGFAAVPDFKPFLSSVMVLSPLGRAALEEAVTKPLERVGYRTDDASLPARMAAELDGQPAALPLLQFAAQALWERRDVTRRLLLQAEYEAFGGASGALAAQAERAVADLAAEQRSLARALMLRLVNADGTRRPRTRVELLSGLVGDATALLDRLLERRLLVSGRPDEGGEPLVELAHESLVTTWPTLARWVAETSEERQFTADVEAAAALWEKRGRRDEETWTGDALTDAQRRLAKWGVSLPQRSAAFLEAGRRRNEARRRRRRALLGAGVAVLSGLTLSATIAALAFREKERQAIAQQEEIRLAAADMGRFELVLEPFDWDADALVATPVSAGKVGPLDWRMYGPSKDSDSTPGAPVDASLVRRGVPRVTSAGLLSEVVEVRNGVTFLSVSGRGRPGESCAPSVVRFRRLPGFAERNDGVRIVVPVPTCQASRAGLVFFDEGVLRRSNAAGQDVEVRVGRFALDRTEAPTALFDVYRRLATWTGDTRHALPPALVPPTGEARLPVTGITAPVADRFCAFLGKRLPRVEEWQRAAASHPLAPPTAFPATHAGGPNLEGSKDGFDNAAPVGSIAGDRTPEGVFDLVGNVGEWTADRVSAHDEDVVGFAGLRKTLGADWVTPAGAPPTDVTWVNSRAEGYTSFSQGVRCASE